MRVSFLVCLGFLCLFPLWGQDDYPDPTTLNIGAPGCIQGSCPPILNGNINPNGGTLTIYRAADGIVNNQALDNSLLLFLGVPNDTAGGQFTGLGASVITSATFSDPGVSSTVTPSFVGFQGLFGPLSGSIYGYLSGLVTGSVGDGLDTFGNYRNADIAALPNLFIDTAHLTNFGIYVYELSLDNCTTCFNVGDHFTVGYNLPMGTFATAYDTYTNPRTQAKAYFGTSLTQSGLETLPEPGSILLLGTAMVLGALLLRKTVHRHKPGNTN